jgi:hypothetical protein
MLASRKRFPSGRFPVPPPGGGVGTGHRQPPREPAGTVGGTGRNRGEPSREPAFPKKAGTEAGTTTSI